MINKKSVDKSNDPQAVLRAVESIKRMTREELIALAKEGDPGYVPTRVEATLDTKTKNRCFTKAITVKIIFKANVDQSSNNSQRIQITKTGDRSFAVVKLPGEIHPHRKNLHTTYQRQIV